VYGGQGRAGLQSGDRSLQGAGRYREQIAIIAEDRR
jgi:hypothetical protein